MKRWHAIVARPQMDVRVAADLEGRGVETFVAMIYRRQKAGSHAWPVPEKWLSPYVFVRIENDQQFDTVRNSLGFDEFLILEPPKPKIFPDEIVQHLKAQTLGSLAEAESRSRGRESLYRIDQRVTVTTGPFAGETGKILAIIGSRLKIESRGPIPIVVKEREVMEA